jgi:regulation of enolase protein 1 (concanavalin A-like superfamily)
LPVRPVAPSPRRPLALFLRLERRADHVSALCSGDGQNWYSVGHALFPAADPVVVGVHAIGSINRAIYHGAYPEGTAIRFEQLQLWQGGSTD